MKDMTVIKDRSFELAERYVQETGVSVYLTGKAGTGKTTFLRSIVRDSAKRCAVVAPTGVAAINAGGVTIHSFFQLPLCPYLPDVKELITEYQLPEKETRLRKERVQILRTLDLLVIDEISMVRADILDAMDYVLRRYRRNDRPFGGVQLLMIGDIQQLPPVVKDAERKYFDQVYPSPFFFNAKALQKLPYITIELETVHRQSDAAFLDILNDVRRGSPSYDTLHSLNSRFDPSFEPPEDENWIRLTTHNAKADEVNHGHMEALDGKERTFRASVEGDFPENSYPAEKEITLKPGAQVMFIRNDASGAGEYYNGKIGTVESLEPEVVVIDEDGHRIVVEPVEWKNIKYGINEETHEIEGHTEGVFTQMPLRLAWAITIHKSQGLTFDRVVIDAGAAFSFGQVYVALSRCRSLEGIVLASRITPRCTFSNSEVRAFEDAYTTFADADGALDGNRKLYLTDNICDAFNLNDLRYRYNRVNRIYQVDLSNTFHDKSEAFKALSEPFAGRLGDEEIAFAGLRALKDTAERFRTQVRHIAATGDETLLKQRVAKAAAYFSDQLTFTGQKVISPLSVEIDNKEVKKVWNEAVKEFLKELQFRIGLYAMILVRGFSLKDFQKLRTDAELASETTVKARVKALEKIVGADEKEAPADDRLVEALTAWRTELSSEKGCPAYVIMHQKTLLKIAQTKPSNKEELLAIDGISKKRCEAYGDAILEIIKKHTDL